MKKMLFLIGLSTFIFLFNRVSDAGQYELMDINGDQKVGLEEAVYALQVVAGIQTNATIEENSTIEETIGYDNDKEDMLKIIMPANGLFQFTIENLNESDSENGYIGRCYLYQEDGADLVELTYVSYSVYSYIKPGDLLASSKIAVYQNGIYYIKVPQYSDHAASYEIKTSFTELETEDSGESDDGYYEARLIQEDDIITSLLGYGDDDADWYKIQISANGQFQFSIQNLHSEDVENGYIGRSYLYEKDGADLVELAYVSYSVYSYIKPGDLLASSKIAVYQNGIYYIKVPKYGHHLAPYQLKTSFAELETKDSGESNNSYNEAQPIQENATIVSLIGYGDDEADWYKIQVSASGQLQFSIANLQSESVENGYIGRSYLYEKDGADLVELAYVSYSVYSYIKPGNMLASSKITVSENGIYYIKVPKYGHHSAPYQLETVFSSD